MIHVSCKCGELILKGLSCENMKIRSKIIVIKEDGAFAVCKGCDTEVKVPLCVDTPLLKSIQAEPPRRIPLYIRKNS